MNQRVFIDRVGEGWHVCCSCGHLRHVSQMPGGASPCLFCANPPAPRQDVPPTVEPHPNLDGRKWFDTDIRKVAEELIEC